MSGDNNDSHHCNSEDASIEQAQYTPTYPSSCAPFAPLIEPPDSWTELRQGDDGNYDRVPRESQIVDLHCRCQAMIPQRILLSDLRRVEEDGVGDEVCDEA